jgi:hypothetical protein
MTIIAGQAIALASLCSLSALYAAPPDEKPKLTARQLFFTDDKPAAPARPATTKPAAAKPAKPAATETSSARPAKPKPVKPVDPPSGYTSTPVSASSTPDGQASVTNASLGAERIPLAIRYSVIKVMPDGEEFEVSPALVFRSGDRVRLRLEANQQGYLYIVARGSSGIWKPLFPAPELGDNLIEARRSYALPSPGHTWTMDAQPGEETLFVVFSRQPVADLDTMIDGLRERRPATPTPPRVTLAKNIDDKFVEQYQTLYARDLVVEKIEAPRSAPVAAGELPAEARRNENAVYVASESTASDARLVASIKLTHR